MNGSQKRWKGIILSQQWRPQSSGLVVGRIVIAPTCPDQQPLPMDAAVQGKKVEIYAAAQIKWTSAPIMDIEHSVLAVDIVGPKLI